MTQMRLPSKRNINMKLLPNKLVLMMVSLIQAAKLNQTNISMFSLDYTRNQKHFSKKKRNKKKWWLK